MDEKLVIASQLESQEDAASVTEAISIDEIALREEKSCWCLCEYNAN
jgi:hypothetical protein